MLWNVVLIIVLVIDTLYDLVQHDKAFRKVLLAEESRLFEFRAIGGQV